MSNPSLISTHVDAGVTARKVGTESLPEVYVWKDDNFQGDGMHQLGGGISELGPIGWDDSISSIAVVSGTWRFYWDYRFGGDYLELGPGTYPSIEAVGKTAAAHNSAGQPAPKAGWNDQISSFQPVSWSNK